MKKVITTVGTSLFANYLEKKDDIKTHYKSIKDGKSYAQYKKESPRIDKHIRPKLLDFAKSNNSSCAELTSIAKIKEQYSEEEIEVYLIATYTIESVVACEVIKDVLKEKGIIVHFVERQDIIDDLQTEDATKFNNGLKNLIARFKEIANNKYGDIVLNITGGYKALIPYLTIMGELFDIPLHYIFEDSEELISIPQLPIGFDDKVADLYLPYLDKAALKLLNSSNEINTEIKTKLIDYGFINVDNKNSLTPLGELFKNYMAHKKTYLGDIIEFLIADLFNNKGLEYKKGVTYPYIENGKDKKGEIDLIVEKDEAIEFFEIKSFGAYKEKQLIRHIEEYVYKYYCDKQKILTILFYLLEASLLKNRKQAFKHIKEIAESKQIEFQVKYIIIRPDNFRNFVKAFKDSEIQIFDY